MEHSLVRHIFDQDLKQINNISSENSKQDPNIRSFHLNAAPSFTLIPPESYAEIVRIKYEQPDRYKDFQEALSTSPATDIVELRCEKIGFHSLKNRLIDRKVISESEKESSQVPLDRIRKLSIILGPINKDEYLPKEVRAQAEKLGVTKFLENPPTIIFGWTELPKTREKSTEIHDILFERLTSVLPIIRLGKIYERVLS